MNIAIIYTQVEENIPDAEAYNEVLDTAKEIQKVLEKNNYNVDLCELKYDIDYAREQLKQIKDKTDIVFNLAEGIGTDTSKESEIIKILEELDIIYTGNNSSCIDSTTNKIKAKRLMRKAQIQTPHSQLFNSQNEELILTFPLIVKPSKEGGSVGIEFDSVVYKPEKLKKKIKEIITKYKQPALVEEYIDGREFNVSILGSQKDLEVLPISEIVFTLPKNKPQILTYAGKWEKNSEDFIKTNSEIADLELSTEEKIKDIAKKIYFLFDCQDYSRIDFRIDSSGNIHVLEINANPCLNTIEPGYSVHIKNKELGYDNLILKIIEYAKKRFKKKEFLKTQNLRFKETNVYDTDNLVNWFNDKQIGKYMEMLNEKYTQESLIESFLETEDDTCSFIICKDQTPIGYCSIYDIDLNAKKAEISFLIGEKEYQGKGYGKEIIEFLLKYAFESLNLNSIYATSAIENIGSIKSLEKNNFNKIGIRKDYNFIDGKYMDEILYDITLNDYLQNQNSQKEIILENKN